MNLNKINCIDTYINKLIFFLLINFYFRRVIYQEVAIKHFLFLQKQYIIIVSHIIFKWPTNYQRLQ